jgi:transposase
VRSDGCDALRAQADDLARAVGRYAKEDFVYLPDEDVYRCPAGELLPRRFSSVLQGRTMITYFSTRCGDCALKSRCTPAKERRVRR